MREPEFRDWLSRRTWNGKALEADMIDGRINRLKRLQRELASLGFAAGSLQEAHAAGLWPQLLERVRGLSADWHSDEVAARSLAPESADPKGAIGNILAAARLYGHFANGRPPDYDYRSDVSADEDALSALRALFLVAFPDFEAGGGFCGHSRYHEVEDNDKRPLIAKVQALLVLDAPDENALGAALLDFVLEDNAINLVGDFRRKNHLRSVRARSAGKLESAVGRLALSEADPADAAAAFVAETWDMILEGSEKSKPYGDSRVLATLFQALARPQEAISVATRKFEHLGKALTGRALFGYNPLTAKEYRTVLALSAKLFDALRSWGWEPRDLWDVQGFIWVTCEEKVMVGQAARDADRIRQHAFENYIAPARERGDGRVSIRAGDVHSALGLSHAHANVCQALRGDKFLQMAKAPRPTHTGPDNSSTTTFTYLLAAHGTSGVDNAPHAPEPTNLILYGPPGTGKTYRTAEEAVRLIDGIVPEGRAALRARYDQLVDAGQIRLVTFHQSYSYEDFVEGLRPVTGADAGGGEGQPGAGFRLEAKRGIFREICVLAEDARKNAGRRGGFDLAGRKVFKMSLGRAGLEDHIFHAAIEGGYVVLGWGGDVDWSPPRFEDWGAILERWREENPGATGSDPNVVQMWPFRSAMNTGDLVIVSEGNSHFRAIGEVTGPYRYDPTDERDYNHRRDVRWLLVPDEALSVETIYGKNFMMQSCYQLKDALLKREALARLLPGDGAGGGGSGVPDQFVLIVDEINRANVSKVFGELITLIEPDKRLGVGEERLTVQLPYSGDTFGVPANLHLVGTMNTADRSIALLDTALRRRFLFREVPPRPDLLEGDVDGVPLSRLLEVMNERIEYLIDRDHRIGHALFMGKGGGSRRAVDATMRDKVIPLLQEYFFEDWSRVAAVLGEPRGKGGLFLDCRKLEDPTGKGDEPRFSWSVRDVFAVDAYRRLIARGAETGVQTGTDTDTAPGAEPVV